MDKHPARTAFDELERLVGRPLERLASAPEASYVTMAVGRTWMFGMRRLEDLRSALVHAWALPSHRDMRLLANQVARLQRGIEEIEQRLDDRDGTPR